MYSYLRGSARPLKVHITNVSDDFMSHLNTLGFNNWKVFASATGWEEQPNFPKDKLIYLSPDSPNVMQELSHDKIYIVGGIVDHNRLKGLSYNTATKLGVATARLPLLENFPDMNDVSININHVFEILTDLAEGKSWKEAISAHVPTRKGFWKARSMATASTTSDPATVTTITSNPPVTNLCCVCKNRFNVTDNNPSSCRFHLYSYSGRLNRVEPTDCSGLEFIWNCCGSTDVDAPGCTLGRHVSYDDKIDD